MGPNVARDQFAEVVAEQLSTELGVRVVDVWAAVSSFTATISADAEAGMGLALAVASTTQSALAGLQQLTDLALTEVTLSDSISLTPANARRHPLVAAWVRDTLPGAIADAISTGRFGFHLSGQAPVFRCFEIVERDGVILFARARYAFAGPHGVVEATSIYGVEDGSIGFGRITVIGGDAAFAIGAAMRGLVAVDGAEVTAAEVAHDAPRVVH